jgi:hypothetical protein
MAKHSNYFRPLNKIFSIYQNNLQSLGRQMPVLGASSEVYSKLHIAFSKNGHFYRLKCVELDWIRIRFLLHLPLNKKNVVLQGDGAGRGSFCPCGGRGQGILTPVQAHEAFQETSPFILLVLMFTTSNHHNSHH